MEKCAYLGEPIGVDKCKQPAHQCNLFHCHVVQGKGNRVVPGCLTCKKHLRLADAKFHLEWDDPLEVLDRRRRQTDVLRNMLSGASVFLACSGPSANDLPLEELNRRGIWTMSVNNMAGHPRLRPHAFVCSDPPMKFSHSIWMDPQIMKFVPTPKMAGGRASLRRKLTDGSFETLDQKVSDCPNIWAFRREAWLTPDDQFFLSNGACWGNHNSGVKRTGEKKTVNTMLLAMRLLRYLGARRVFMIGVDFWMNADRGYSFPQGIDHKRPKDGSRPQWDNRQYEVVDNWLCRMQKSGVFERFGIEFYNCFQSSGLRAFPYVPFETAVKLCQGIVEDAPDLVGWYEK